MVQQTKVFIGSLPLGSKPEDLRRMFERYGVVTECDVMNRCGFVHMQTEEMASDAIRGLNNSSFNGGVITVERGRIKERGGRPSGPPRGGMERGSGPGGMRNGMGMGMGGGGGMRNGMGVGAPRRPGGGGPMRGPPMGGARDGGAPYMRDSRPPMGDMGGRGPMGGMGMRNGGGGGGGGYDRGMDRRGGNGYPDDRLGFSGEDRRGFALMDNRGMGGNFGGGGGGGGGNMYPEERRGGYPMDERRGGGMFPDERRGGGGGMFPEDRQNMMMDRRSGGMRPPPMPMPPSFERGAPRGNPMANGDMFSRRSPPPMRGGAGFGDRDPYNQQFPPLGRVGGGGPRGGRDIGMGPRRY